MGGGKEKRWENSNSFRLVEARKPTKSIAVCGLYLHWLYDSQMRVNAFFNVVGAEFWFRNHFETYVQSGVKLFYIIHIERF